MKGRYDYEFTRKQTNYQGLGILILLLENGCMASNSGLALSRKSLMKDGALYQEDTKVDGNCRTRSTRLRSKASPFFSPEGGEGHTGTILYCWRCCGYYCPCDSLVGGGYVCEMNCW